MAKREPIDVICQHSQDGTIVPLKIRVRDDDGEYQAYMIQGFREEERRGGITTKDGVYINSHVTVYECQITTGRTPLWNSTSTFCPHTDVRAAKSRSVFGSQAPDPALL